MANYYTQAVFQPEIPTQFISESDKELFDAFGLTMEIIQPRNACYLYATEWTGWATNPDKSDDADEELAFTSLYQCLQDIIKRSNDELPWIYKEAAWTCSKMRPDGFGGEAVFITADSIEYVSTSGWLEHRIDEFENGDTHD